jgi:hypothetical protein
MLGEEMGPCIQCNSLPFLLPATIIPKDQPPLKFCPDIAGHTAQSSSIHENFIFWFFFSLIFQTKPIQIDSWSMTLNTWMKVPIAFAHTGNCV